ncbi:MAG: helix-turn-helix transcriptional regulator [Bacteroidota bacterium]
MRNLLHFSTLRAYCAGISIAPPKEEEYDIRSFEENMATIKQQMPPFKHEFYAIALKLDGEGYATTGNFDTKDLQATVFFNSPYQITHWDIAPNWSGYYVMFTEEFYRRAGFKKRISEQFPFLLSDYTMPLRVSKLEAESLHRILDSIHFEHHHRTVHHLEIIQHFLHILLLKTARLYYQQQPTTSATTRHQRDSDLSIVARFKTLLETAFYPDKSYKDTAAHQVQFYAEQLLIHPNHLNSLVKRITENSASELIQNHLLTLAKSKLRNSNLSVKEIAYALHFKYPNHFSAFFKKQLGMTPNAFRKQ